MANDDDDFVLDEQSHARERSEGFPTSYHTALAIWIGPALVVGMLMGVLNLRTYDTVLAINLDDGEDFMRQEQRTACGWPYVLASRSPTSHGWSLSGFGVVVDGIIAFAAMVITAGTCRFVGAIIDEKVSDPIPKQIRRLLRGKPKKKVAAKRSAPSGRMTTSGPPRVRRPQRPVDE